MRRSVIVLDGPAGAGKSSVAREVAHLLDLPFLDTGAIYRAITLVMTRGGIAPSDSPELRAALDQFELSFDGGRVICRGEDVSSAIRTPEIDANVSAYSALPVVREALLSLQRSQASNGLVAEGRDMGTVVFPNADTKIFLTASAEARARRRCAEREAKGEHVDFAETLASIERRDEIDSTRDASPLKAAPDAVTVDTTDMTFDEVVRRVMEIATSGQHPRCAASSTS